VAAYEGPLPVGLNGTSTRLTWLDFPCHPSGEPVVRFPVAIP
jgi:hypothetical protein